MPLIRVDMIEGRSPDEIKALLDATHRTLVSVFKIPQRDRYQIIHGIQPHTSSWRTPDSASRGRANASLSKSRQGRGIGRRRRASTTCSAASWSRRAAYRRPTSSCRWLRTLTRIGPSGTAARNS